MGRMVDVDDLVDREQIAAHYRVTSQAVSQWFAKEGFPAPVRTARGRIWLLSEIAAWRETQPPIRRWGESEHGTARRYHLGCRCAICRAGNTERYHQFRARHDGLPEGDPRHGSLNGYRNYRCRCKACVAANSAASADYKRRFHARVYGGDAS
jgi:hypothetical protein